MKYKRDTIAVSSLYPGSIEGYYQAEDSQVITEIAQRKQVPLLIMNGASLLHIEVFAQLHALCQFEMDLKTLLPIILTGQNNLLDKLMYHASRPLTSRVIGGG